MKTLNDQEYEELLKTCPEDHFSYEFIQFLRDNNKVIEETDNWLIIENCKDPKDYTAFFIRDIWKEDNKMFLMDSTELLKKYGDREWKIKAPHKRTVELFHVHLIKKQ